MAKYALGDIPGARFHEPFLQSVAAVASNGANGRIGQFGPFAHDIRVRNVWYSPTAGDQAATQSATYRRLSLFNGGTAGTVTATANRIASLNASASQASQGAAAFTIIDPTGTTETVPAGAILYFSQETVGGTDANGTVLAAGQLALAYEVV